MAVAGNVVHRDLINVIAILFCSDISSYVCKTLKLLPCICFHLERKRGLYANNWHVHKATIDSVPGYIQERDTVCINIVMIFW